MTVVEGRPGIEPDESIDGRRAAAGIWARAVSRRDRVVEPATAEEKLPVIQEGLSAPSATLHLARRGEDAAGFIFVVPRGDVLEIRFLAVDPAGWGGGVGSDLLRYADDLARAGGARSLELWVLESNERARRLYERAGWSETDDLKTQVSSGRVERRLVRQC